MRLIVGMTGATRWASNCWKSLRSWGVETHLILSDWARATIETETETETETEYSVDEVRALARYAGFTHAARHGLES
jgi:4-hydroxy-3-polyprenylbenzoate decarboxylase